MRFSRAKVRHLQLAPLQRATATSHAGGVAAGRRLRGGGFPQLPVPGIAGRGAFDGISVGELLGAGGSDVAVGQHHGIYNFGW